MDDDKTTQFGVDTSQESYITQDNDCHYITFTNLNDQQWIVLDCDKSYIVPDGYAYYFTKQTRIYAYKEILFEGVTKIKNNFNDQYSHMIKLIFNRLNFLYLPHTSLNLKILTLVEYLNSHSWGSK